MTNTIPSKFLEEQDEHETVRELIAELVTIGREQGYLSLDDIAEHFPSAEEDVTLLDDLYAALIAAGVPFLENGPDEDTGENGSRPEARRRPDNGAAAASAGSGNPLDEIEVRDIVGLYLKDAAGHPLLTADQEVELSRAIERGRAARAALVAGEVPDRERDRFEARVRTGQEAFDHLIRSNTRLVISIAKKYQRRGLPLTDLIQAGNLGLLRAAKKFDIHRGNRFSTYATWWIRQAVSRAVADQGRTIRIPVHQTDKLSKILRVRKQLVQKLDRDPTYAEIAEHLALTPAKVEEIIRQTRFPLSLERPVGFDGDAVLGDFIEDDHSPSPEESATENLMQDEVREALLEALPAREARILRLRFGFQDGKPLTLQEVGEREGITRERVRQIEARAFRRLRQPDLRQKLRAFLDRNPGAR
ncbi:MAG TPA: sigma-70 family RNA polymerase sigma factor [Anaerolineales bacterium]|nr:sigma-70 family RNA polymerase sigma factor [Anaerolineales bacterium]